MGKCVKAWNGVGVVECGFGKVRFVLQCSYSEGAVMQGGGKAV